MGNKQSNIKHEEESIKDILEKINNISNKLLNENKKFFLFPKNCQAISIVANKELNKLKFNQLKNINNDLTKYNIVIQNHIDNKLYDSNSLRNIVGLSNLLTPSSTFYVKDNNIIASGKYINNQLISYKGGEYQELSKNNIIGQFLSKETNNQPPINQQTINQQTINRKNQPPINQQTINRKNQPPINQQTNQQAINQQANNRKNQAINQRANNRKNQLMNQTPINRKNQSINQQTTKQRTNNQKPTNQKPKEEKNNKNISRIYKNIMFSNSLT
tara:strand:+ start:323 stop:1144 length:822 start_codon:yes stop_codon:yes gene_type:complete